MNEVLVEVRFEEEMGDRLVALAEQGDRTLADETARLLAMGVSVLERDGEERFDAGARCGGVVWCRT